MTDAPVLDVDLTEHALYREGFPYARFAELRQEHAVWRHPTAYLSRSPDGIDFWAVLGHPELLEVSRDWRTFSSMDGASISPTGDAQRGHTLVSADPPVHTRMRKLISAGFTPRMIRRLDEQVLARTTQVLDAAAAQGTCNYVRDVAYQLTMDDAGALVDRWIAAGIQDLAGVPDEVWLAQPIAWEASIEPGDRDEVLAAWNDLETRGTPFDVQYRMRHADGHLVWVHDRAAMTEREGKRIIDGAYVDISLWRRAEVALGEAEDRFRTLVEQLPAITFI